MIDRHSAHASRPSLSYRNWRDEAEDLIDVVMMLVRPQFFFRSPAQSRREYQQGTHADNDAQKSCKGVANVEYREVLATE
jgi:hypothetical protein